MLNWAAILWLVLLVLFFIAEAATVTLISLWFSAGCLGALVVNMLGGPFWLQIAIFLVVSVVAISSLRPLVRRYIKPRVTATNIDSLIGATGTVTEDINNASSRGQVKLGAMPWTARSTQGDIIVTGTPVRVDRIEGVKVYVTPVW